MTKHGNPVRRDAYERAMQLLNGRAALADRLTPEQREVVRAFDGPEIVGDRSRLPSAKHNEKTKKPDAIP